MTADIDPASLVPDPWWGSPGRLPALHEVLAEVFPAGGHGSVWNGPDDPSTIPREPDDARDEGDEYGVPVPRIVRPRAAVRTAWCERHSYLYRVDRGCPTCTSTGALAATLHRRLTSWHWGR